MQWEVWNRKYPSPRSFFGRPLLLILFHLKKQIVNFLKSSISYQPSDLTQPIQIISKMTFFKNFSEMRVPHVSPCMLGKAVCIKFVNIGFLCRFTDLKYDNDTKAVIHKNSEEIFFLKNFRKISWNSTAVELAWGSF